MVYKNVNKSSCCRNDGGAAAVAVVAVAVAVKVVVVAASFFRFSFSRPIQQHVHAVFGMTLSTEFTHDSSV